MLIRCSSTPALTGLLLTLASASPAAAQFVVNNSGNPGGAGVASYTEQLDFCDVDLDGDWDVAFADTGGGNGTDQNRIWINVGGLQAGSLGVFSDQTSTRFPSTTDTSRDIEFADIDGDGDCDLYITNTSDALNQGARWWVNQGGQQGQTAGFFADETAARWIGLGQPGSSIPPGALIAGTWVDWGADGDFGDLDNDGDLDLVHTSISPPFDFFNPLQRTPNRIFLNDGSGHFSEFNPSGHQLTTAQLDDGDPALWALGLQAEGTMDTTGQFTDVASRASDVSIGDVDGDFDLDILLGALGGSTGPGSPAIPRLFQNRLEEVSALEFRDETFARFEGHTAIAADGGYDQELGDLDGDGDLDLYCLNWVGFNDRTYANDGNGMFTIGQSSVASSGTDDEEADFVDFDADGDLDVVVANFSGSDRIHVNNGTGALALQQFIASPGGSPRTIDAEVADIDGDGDYDIMLAKAGSFGASAAVPNVTLTNITDLPDSTPPYVPSVENDGDRAAAPGSFSVRAQVYDNAPYYITWYNPTALAFEVDGVQLASSAMGSSYGQIFRGVLPANLVGPVTYRVESADEYGNTGVSADQSYVGSTALSFATTFGVGTAGVSGTPTLSAASVPFAGSTLYLTSTNLTGGATYFLYLTDAALPSPLFLPGIGNINVAGNVLGFFVGLVGSGNDVAVQIPVGASVPAGISVFAQIFGTDGAGGTLISSSPGLEIVTQ